MLPPFPLHPHSWSSLPNKPSAPNRFLVSGSASQGTRSGDRGCGRQSHLLASCISTVLPACPPRPGLRPRSPVPSAGHRWTGGASLMTGRWCGRSALIPAARGHPQMAAVASLEAREPPLPMLPPPQAAPSIPEALCSPCPSHQPRVSPGTLSRLHQPPFVDEGNLDSRGQECALPTPGPPPFAKALLILPGSAEMLLPPGSPS